jgi:divalent anion:Na+ symporter, DASS family
MTQTVRFKPLASVVVLGLAIWAMPAPSGIDARAWPLFAIFVSTIAGLVVQPMPMGAVALVAIGVALLTRTLVVSEVLSGFANATLWLVTAAFFLATGFVKTGLGARIAYGLMALFGRSTLGLGYSLILTDLILAPAIASSTARAGGVLFPILQALARMAQAQDPSTGQKTSAYLTLTVYQGTVVTSAMFLTATVVNPLCVQLAASHGITITWATWAAAGIVPGLASLSVVPPLVYRLCPPGVTQTPEAPRQARMALSALEPMTRAEWTMSVVAVLLISAWIFGAAIDVDATSAALIAHRSAASDRSAGMGRHRRRAGSLEPILLVRCTGHDGRLLDAVWTGGLVHRPCWPGAARRWLAVGSARIEPRVLL